MSKIKQCEAELLTRTNLSMLTRIGSFVKTHTHGGVPVREMTFLLFKQQK